MTIDLRKRNRVWIEAWDDGDYVITVDGFPVGQSDSEKSLVPVRYWLESALTELEMRAVARFEKAKVQPQEGGKA